MSVNAFLDAYSGVQNALGDPRGDAERRRQQEMQNAMQQRQMQMREFEFSQQQQEAQRAEQARQAQMARQRAQMQFRGGSMYPSQQPQQAAPAASMTGGAPIEAMPQGQAFVDDATGKEGASYTATAMQRGPAPTQEEELDFLMRDAYQRGDVEGFNQYFDLRRQNMSAEEKAGRQQIAVVAGQIARLPDDQLAAAVVQAMQQFGIDPATTKIDDYLNNPAELRRALQLEMALGAPEESAKEAVRVQGTFDQFRPFEREDLGNRVGVFDPRTGRFTDGPRVGLSPNTAATTSTQLQTARIGAGSRIEAARLGKEAAAAMAAAGGKIELVPADDLPEGE